MIKLFLQHLTIIIALSSTAFALYPEIYKFEQTSVKNSCKLEIFLEAGKTEEIKISLNMHGDKNLTNEEIALGINKAWPNEISWEETFIDNNLIWIEGVVDGINRKIAQSAFQRNDKLKIFFTGNLGNFRAVFDLYIKIIPVDDGKAADLYFTAVRNSKKSAQGLFKEKFSGDSQTIKDDKSSCFTLDTKMSGDADVVGEIWGVKTLRK